MHLKLKPVLGIAAGLLLLGLLVWQVSRAVHRTFQPPVGVARLARTTPAFQNGLSLVDIANVSPDGNYQYDARQGMTGSAGGSNAAPAADTGLWIKMPPGASLPLNCTNSQDSGCGTMIDAAARLSNGQRVPLSWRMSWSGRSTEAYYLLVSLPAGYPDTVRWADVTVDDRHGGTATWRILDLPPMQHVLAPPVTPQATFQQGNIQFQAHAYRGPVPDFSSFSHTSEQLSYSIKGTVTTAANDWEITNFALTREWEPPGYTPPGSGSTFGGSKTGTTETFDVSQQSVSWNQQFPYLSSTHWVRLGAVLQEYTTYDEIVAFHNVSFVLSADGSGMYLAGAGPQTITTPSGITLTLNDVQHQKGANGTAGSSGVRLSIHYPQTRKYPSLPRSPLWRRHNGLISVSIEFPKPFELAGSGYSDTDGTYWFQTPKPPLPKSYAAFPIIVRQRVDLRAVPMTFTLPVAKAP